MASVGGGFSMPQYCSRSGSCQATLLVRFLWPIRSPAFLNHWTPAELVTTDDACRDCSCCLRVARASRNRQTRECRFKARKPPMSAASAEACDTPSAIKCIPNVTSRVCPTRGTFQFCFCSASTRRVCRLTTHACVEAS